MRSSLSLLALATAASAGTVLWDGRAPKATDISAWAWSNQVGAYQYYIKGPGTNYLDIAAANKNPADTGSESGIKVTLDSTSYWNGQNMRRTELIPQTSAAINTGKVYYHFSMKKSTTNPPSEFREHQIMFFESHFTETKSGWQSGASGTSDPLLRWNAASKTQWSTNWEADVWHNVAYGIDFSANTVEFYHSTGSEDLKLTVSAVAVTASSDGKDFHVGVLELPREGYADADEDIYFSGVYVESGEITLSVSGPGGAAAAAGSSGNAVSSASTKASTVTPEATKEALIASVPTTLATSVKPTAALASTTKEAVAESYSLTTTPTSTAKSGVSTSTSDILGALVPATTKTGLIAQIQAYIITLLTALKQLNAETASSS